MYSDLSDEQLMGRFKAGDAGAFEALLRRHRTPVFTFIVRMVGDRTRAEDLAQETFLKVVKGAGSWVEKAKFTTWLYTVARNQCLDFMRREKLRRTESLDAPASMDDEDKSLVETMASPLPAVDRAAESARLRPLLARALAALPDEQREVFVLREYAGVPFKEIAEMTGAPENTVKSRMRYALDALRRALAAMGVDADAAEDEPLPQAVVR